MPANLAIAVKPDLTYVRVKAPNGTVRGEYDIPTPNSGARCITALTDGRLFFTQYDAGLIGEVVVR